MHRAADDALALMIEGHPKAAAVFRHGNELRARKDFDSLSAEGAANNLGRFRRMIAEQLVAALDEGHTGADPAKELRELGWQQQKGVLSRDGRPLRFELLTVAGNPERERIAERLKQDWAALGIDVAVTSVPQAELVNVRLPEHRFDAALLGLDFEGTWDLSPFWHSSQARSGLNFSGLADPELDRLLDALRLVYDPERVAPLAHEAEDRVLSLHPYLPLLSGARPMALRSAALEQSPGLKVLMEGDG